MEFTLAEAESIDLAKKGVAEMLTVSAGGNTKLYKLHTVLFSHKSSLPLSLRNQRTLKSWSSIVARWPGKR